MSGTKAIGIIGGTGYVSGELLRLLAGHPDLELDCIASDSSPGTTLAETFPNLAGSYPGKCFASMSELEARWRDGALAGIFCAAPHGTAAALVDRLLSGEGPCPGSIVDISADFRFPDPVSFEGIYGQAHCAPALMSRFTCAVSEHLAEIPTRHVAQPGCFATAMLLGVVPMIRSGLVDGEFFISGVTGSTGSGRSLSPTTHHPERHSNVFAYKPLCHRHAPEVETIAGAVAGRQPRVHFVPHSGPFARGIHVAIQGRLAEDAEPTALRTALEETYRGHRFVEVIDVPPRIKDVVGSNRARLHLACDDGGYVLLVVIDNLVKGAAGGAMQWMNRLLGLPESAGLTAPGPAWV